MQLTKLRKEEQLKKLKSAEIEKIEVLGQSSDLKAKPWVEKEVAEQEKKELDYFNNSLGLLQSREAKRSKVVYNRLLTQIFLHHAAAEDIPRKYPIEVDVNEIGLVIKIKGTQFVGAFKASGLPSYDAHACKIMAVKLGNTIAHLEGYRREVGGVLLPDEEDQKNYGRTT